jgi:hypothetical protein
LPPILVVFDYHNDSGKSSLEQASSEGFLFMTKPQLNHTPISVAQFDQKFHSLI